MALPDPLQLAQAACETIMQRYSAEDLPPKRHFHYHQGVFLSGLLKTASLCGKESYWKYASDWIHYVFTPEGRIKEYAHGDLDDIQPGILLFSLLEHDPENAAFYHAALDSVFAQTADIPRCQCGGFYHKVSFTGQMWLDGLYMACPFLTEYARRFGRPDLRELAVQEILLMRQHTKDPATGLWHHAWDETRQSPWADPNTGLSPEFWGRSLGWVPVAVLDVLAQMQPEDYGYQELTELVKELLEVICSYQSDDGRWYQVIDKGGHPGNWLENSCSCLFAAALSRAVRIGLLEQPWLDRAVNAYKGVVNSLTWQNDEIEIGNVCIGTGVGDYDFYCRRPVSTNDLHGVGAFLLMCTELKMALEATKVNQPTAIN